MGDKDQLTATVPANSVASVPIYINPTFQNRGKDKYKLKKKHKASKAQFSFNVKSWEDICFSKNSFALLFNPCFGPKWNWGFLKLGSTPGSLSYSRTGVEKKHLSKFFACLIISGFVAFTVGKYNPPMAAIYTPEGTCNLSLAKITGKRNLKPFDTRGSIALW